MPLIAFLILTIKGLRVAWGQIRGRRIVLDAFMWKLTDEVTDMALVAEQLSM